MSQPSHPDSSTDFDPLDAFEQEIAALPAEVPESVPAPPAVAPPPAPPDPSRIELAEAEILKLRSEVATLVGVINDITRQLRRPVATGEVEVPRVKTAPRLRAELRRAARAPVVGVIAGLVLGVMTWRALTTVEVPEAPSISAEPEAEPVASPAPPQSMVSPPQLPGPVKAAAVVTTVRDDDPAPLVRRRSYVGSLSIDAAPGGDVFVDRKRAGPTPLRLNNLRAGSHLVWVERDGYRRWTRVVQVPADRISRVFADLERADER